MLGKASKHLQPDLPLIGIAALLSSLGGLVDTQSVMLTSVVTALLIEVVIFARIASRMRAIPPASWLTLLQENFVNYLLVTLVIFSPVLILNILVPLLGANFLTAGFSLLLVLSLPAVTIYVVPVIFLRRLSLLAIPIGLSFLRYHFRASLPIIAIALSATVLGTAGNAMAVIFFDPDESVILFRIVASVIGFITWYLSVLAFSAATYILISTNRGATQNGA